MPSRMQMQISLVLPAFNNQKMLDRSLCTLKAQVQSHALECIVVDDGSKVPLTVPYWVRLLRIERHPISRGSSAAKNHGARHAEGDTLVFIDSDILCLKDTLLSMQHAMHACDEIKEYNMLLNVMRISLPEGYPIMRMRDTEKLLRKCRTANLLNNEKMDEPVVCWEQNVGMIRKEFFDRIGCYDDVTFRSWGMNNQDLSIRVFKAGGRVTSYIPRTINKHRLHCFHPWHLSQRSRWHADKEFSSKWGEPFSQALMVKFMMEAEDVRRGNSQSDSVQDSGVTAATG